jgi:hypothetical protein
MNTQCIIMRANPNQFLDFFFSTKYPATRLRVACYASLSGSKALVENWFAYLRDFHIARCHCRFFTISTTSRLKCISLRSTSIATPWFFDRKKNNQAAEAATASPTAKLSITHVNPPDLHLWYHLLQTLLWIKFYRLRWPNVSIFTIYVHSSSLDFQPDRIHQIMQHPLSIFQHLWRYKFIQSEAGRTDLGYHIFVFFIFCIIITINLIALSSDASPNLCYICIQHKKICNRPLPCYTF